MNKKDLPIILLQSLNRLNSALIDFADENKHLLIKSYNKNKLLLFKDIDNESQFKFELKEPYMANNGPAFKIELAPSSNSSNALVKQGHNEQGIILMFKSWLNWLEIYEDSHLTEEDKILAQYQEEFFSEFEIIDENANEQVFGLEQQIYLDSYLSESTTKLSKFIGTKDEEFDTKINELIEEAKALKDAVPNETKEQVVSRLTKFWAKARKTGIEVIKELLVQGVIEIGKQLLLGGGN